MPPKCSVRDDWFTRTDNLGNVVSSWAVRVDSTHIRCVVCSSTFSCERAGYQAIGQHVTTAKHKENARVKLNSLQLRLAAAPSSTSTATPATHNQERGGESSGAASKCPPTLSVICKRDAALRAEILWVIKCVGSNYSARSCVDISELFVEMFHDGVPEGFTLSRTKFSYLLNEAIGPHFRKLLLDDLSNSFYVLCFDETTNDEGKKELQTSVRYWSSTCDEVMFSHLETFFIGRATSEILKSHLLQALDNADLSLSKLAMLSCDGPNVNKAVYRLVSTEVKEHRGKGLLDLGTCNLHIVHNAFLAGLEQFGADVSQLAVTVFSFFDDWPGRWEDFCKVQARVGVPSHKFLTHVSSRWLTLRSAAERLIEQWPALREYFLRELPKSGTSSSKKLTERQSFRQITQMLKDPSCKAQLAFVCDSAEMFERFTGFFQREEPLIHVLCEEVTTLTTIVMGRACKPETVKKLHSEKEPFATDNLLPVNSVRCGERSEKELVNMKECDALLFRKKVQEHYVAAASHLLSKSIIRIPQAKYFSCLKPEERTKPDSVNRVVKLSRILPVDISETRLEDEWKILSLEDLAQESGLRIDHYWRRILAIKSATGDPKFPTISTVVRCSLILAHGSADVERAFSTSGKVLTPETTRMAVNTLNAKLNVKSALRRYGGKPHLVPVNSELLTSARFASQKYKEHLQREREEAEKRAIKQREEEEERRQREEREKDNENTRKKLDKLEKELKDEKKTVVEKKKAADMLLDEVNDRLQKAVKRKDFDQIQVAQAMLEGVKKMRGEIRSEEEKAAKLQLQIDRKKSGLISSYFSKEK